MDNQNPYIKYGPQQQNQAYSSQNYTGYNPQFAGYNPWQQPYNAKDAVYPQSQGPTLQSINQGQVTPVFGKWVDSPNEIAPRDVPMDGTIALFPSRKGDVIYAKAWDSNGSIATIEFHPVQDSSGPATSSEFDTIMEKLNRIEERLNYKRYDQKKDKSDNS